MMADEFYRLTHSADQIDAAIDLADTLSEEVDTKASKTELNALADTVAALQTAVSGKASVSDVYGLGTLIPANSDLNDYTSPGRYRISSVQNARTLLNSPSANTFILEVHVSTNTNRYLQVLTECSAETALVTVYRRAYTQAGWGSWYRFSGEEVV